MTDSTNPIATALAATRQTIRELEARYQRATGSVQLLAVSKTRPLEAVRVAMDAGQQSFGENYLDEALPKINAIEGAQWHFIGAIQSRKTARIAQHFDWVHSVDRAKIAQRLSDQRSANQARLNVCLQVNIDQESSKSGASVADLAALADFCAALPRLSLRGLMAIPAPRQTLHEQREVFAQIRKLFTELQNQHPSLDTLSIGMSGDLEAAIAEGATIVRTGTAIFGNRC